MRDHRLTAPHLALALGCLLLLTAGAARALDKVDGESNGANYDEVIRDLIANFSRDSSTAQDAALKLAKLGKRAVPVLSELLSANLPPPPPPAGTPPPETKGNPQLAFYSVLALSRIKAVDAAKPLLPLLGNEKGSPELRTLALEALGLELLADSAPVLQKIAASDPDTQLRKKAYAQLSVMPAFWVKAEKLFVDALSDPDGEIRTLAARQCYYCRIYLSATDKLIEVAEKDAEPAARLNAMLALSRMRARKAVPALARLVSSADTPPAAQQQALRALNAITGVTLKDAAAVQNWWKKLGEAEYAKLEAPPQAPPAGPTQRAVVVPADNVPPDDQGRDKDARDRKAAP